MDGTDAVLSEALFFCQIFNFNKNGSYTVSLLYCKAYSYLIPKAVQ